MYTVLQAHTVTYLGHSVDVCWHVGHVEIGGDQCAQTCSSGLSMSGCASKQDSWPARSVGAAPEASTWITLHLRLMLNHASADT